MNFLNTNQRQIVSKATVCHKFLSPPPISNLSSNFSVLSDLRNRKRSKCERTGRKQERLINWTLKKKSPYVKIASKKIKRQTIALTNLLVYVLQRRELLQTFKTTSTHNSQLSRSVQLFLGILKIIFFLPSRIKHF